MAAREDPYEGNPAPFNPARRKPPVDLTAARRRAVALMRERAEADGIDLGESLAADCFTIAMEALFA